MAKDKTVIPDTEKTKALRNICEHIISKLQLPRDSFSSGNWGSDWASISLLRYKDVEIWVRVTKKKFNPQEREKLCVDCHVWIKSPGNISRFSSLQHTFENEVPTGGVKCVWQGKQVLVHYYVPVNWQDWNNISDADRALVSNAFAVMRKILIDSGNGKIAGDKNSSGKRKTGRLLVSSVPKNLIVFGAPGTGKSHFIENIRKTLPSKDVLENEAATDKAGKAFFSYYDRVTFYPTYSYAQFVGTYKPVVDDKKEISYEFVPGPFLRLLSEALKNPGSNYLLIIEEINRANAAAVFGDMFQLLDRMSDGLSEYGISLAEDIKKWLKDDAKVQPIAVGADDKDKEVAWNGDMLRLPKNFYIWATMNSADQGVFPLDTAFKRRWEFKYIEVDGAGPKNLWIETGLGAYYWDALRKAINEKLLTAGKVNEDKLLGPWFLKDEGNQRISAEKFSSKVLMYLWEDAARMCRRQFFSDKIAMLSDLMDKWSEASGCPGEEGETLTEAFRFEGVKGLKFRKKVFNHMVGNEIKIEVKKGDDGSIQKNDAGNPLFTVTFNEEMLEGKAYSEEWTEEGNVKLNIECDKCYGEIEYQLGENDKDDAETDTRLAGDAGGNAAAPAAEDGGGKDDTDAGTPTA